MAWLRIDDGFATNPKIAELTDRELRIWLRVLCYCAQQQDPSVDRVTIHVVSGLTLKVIRKLLDVGLLDESGGDFEVHDWVKYQPKDLTGADRQARWRARRNAERNGTSNGLRNASNRYGDRDETVTSRVGARARPVPVPKELTPTPNPTLDVEHELPDLEHVLKDMPL